MSEPRTARRTAQGAASRERILEAAIELIAERGFAATSVDALCRRAGIVRTALYWHFGSKEGLLAAAVERVAGTWIDEIRKSAYQAGEPVERLDRALAGMRALVEERPQLLQLLTAIAFERTRVAPETRDTLRRVFARAQDAIVRGIEDAVGAPLPDLDLVAHQLLALVQAALFRRLIEPDVDLDRLFGEIRRTVLLAVALRVREAGLDDRLPPGVLPG